MPAYSECVAEIRRLLRSILADQGVKADDLGEQVDLVEELGMASIEVMELIEQLEDRFDIAFPLNDLADIRTIADLARHVQQLGAATG